MTNRTPAVITRLLAAAALVLVAAACGSDSSQDASQSSAATVEADDAETVDGTEPADDGETVDDDDAASDDADGADEAGDDGADAAGSGGDAMLTLANGETVEFAGVLCALEPQESAGSEILFTAVSYGDPGLDITQFGDEGTITDVASISVYDAEYETLWEANSMFGSAVELTVDGTTIRGSGSFIEGGDMMNEPVEGEIVANC